MERPRQAKDERAPLSVNFKGYATASVENSSDWSWNSSQSCSGPCLELGNSWGFFYFVEELTQSEGFPLPFSPVVVGFSNAFPGDIP